MSDHQCKGPSSAYSSPSDRMINVFWDDGMLNHDTGKGVFDTGMDPGYLDVLEKHPENSDRIRNMLSILKRGPISPFILWHSSTPALVSELLSFHTPGNPKINSIFVTYYPNLNRINALRLYTILLYLNIERVLLL